MQKIIIKRTGTPAETVTVSQLLIALNQMSEDEMVSSFHGISVKKLKEFYNGVNPRTLVLVKDGDFELSGITILKGVMR